MYRSIEIAWRPQSPAAWATFTASRLEAARLWADLIERHRRIRRLRWKWPSYGRWCKWAKGRYPNMNAQSVQQTIGEFLEAVKSACVLRKNGHADACFPWRTARYHDVTYTNQKARVRDDYVLLPNGKAGTLRVPISKTRVLPGRIMEARLTYGTLTLVCEVSDSPVVEGPLVGVDLGVNTLIAATDGKTAILISGRAAKATVQWRNKNLASIFSALSRKTKRSRRYTKLKRRMYGMLEKAKRRIRDINHKATRKVADAFPNAQVVVGKPFNDAARKMGRKQAQQVSQACNRKIIDQLHYKTSGARDVPEPYSSQTCPVCGCRQKCRRLYKCQQCGFIAPRDVVGALNIRMIGEVGSLQPKLDLVCPMIVWGYPSKYRDPKSRSSGGTPASSSEAA